MSTKRLKCDDAFFQKVATEKQAYWLGFIAADGCVYKNRNMLSIKLANKDVKHLEKFKQDIKACSSVFTYQKYSQIRISSAKLKDDLAKLNIFHRKTINFSWANLIKSVPTSLHRHVFRGFFDGDGCWYIAKEKRKGLNRYLMFCITGYSRKTLEEMNHFLEKEQIGLSIYTIGNNWRLQTKKKENCRKLFHLMYDDASTFLKRKKVKAQEIIL